MRKNRADRHDSGGDGTAVCHPIPTQDDLLFTALVLDPDSLTDDELLEFIPRGLRRAIRSLKARVETSHVTYDVTAPTASGAQKLILTTLTLPLLGHKRTVILPDAYVATAIRYLLDRWFLKGMRSGKIVL